MVVSRSLSLSRFVYIQDIFIAAWTRIVRLFRHLLSLTHTFTATTRDSSSAITLRYNLSAFYNHHFCSNYEDAKTSTNFNNPLCTSPCPQSLLRATRRTPILTLHLAGIPPQHNLQIPRRTHINSAASIESHTRFSTTLCPLCKLSVSIPNSNSSTPLAELTQL